VLLLVLFAYTATIKFLDYNKFVFQMRLAPLPLMKFAAPMLGWLMPAIEMAIAIGLLFIRFRLTALYTSVILLLVFEIYIIGMLLSGHDLPCTCGGIISKMSWKQHLAFNAIFILVGLTGILQYRKYKLIPPAKNGAGNIKVLHARKAGSAVA
jgi:putative oxidoreductase